MPVFVLFIVFFLFEIILVICWQNIFPVILEVRLSEKKNKKKLIRLFESVYFYNSFQIWNQKKSKE